MARIGIAPCFFIDGLSFLAVIAGLLMMNPPRKTPAPRNASPLRHALGGLAYVRHNRRVLTLLSLFTVVGIFGWSYSVLMPSYARDVLRVSETGYGVLMSAAGCGAMIGALRPLAPLSRGRFLRHDAVHVHIQYAYPDQRAG
jgi:predicted MFS family arabinose efflux permease